MREIITEYDWNKSVGYLKYIAGWPSYYLSTASGMRALFREKFLRDVKVSERERANIIEESKKAKEHACLLCAKIIAQARPFLPSHVEKEVIYSDQDWKKMRPSIESATHRGSVFHIESAASHDPAEFNKLFKLDQKFWDNVRTRI